tara:strand:- start:19327 stop:19962 length:636 start_codon:yes stop_codon:yes gene_type:complete
MWANILSKLFIILGTIYIAEKITYKYGNKKERTTNKMPYPSNITTIEQNKIKLLYTRAQFLATINVITEDPISCFIPVLAIQIAPFLMTLIRKGKIRCIIYHRVYALTLWLPFLIFLCRVINDTESVLHILWYGIFTSRVVVPLRLRDTNVYIVWIIGVVGSIYSYEVIYMSYMHSLYLSNKYIMDVLIIIIYSILGPINKFAYLPLFINS